MKAVEDCIYALEEPRQRMMLFFHQWFTQEFSLTDKITFGNPCYYRKSWICYLKPLKNKKVELAFLRGNELSNHQGLLKSGGRKQVRSLEFSNLDEIPLDTLREILHEALVLDETKPYASKRKKNM